MTAGIKWGEKCNDVKVENGGLDGIFTPLNYSARTWLLEEVNYLFQWPADFGTTSCKRLQSWRGLPVYIEATEQHWGKYVHGPAIKSSGTLRPNIFETIDCWEFPSCSSKPLGATDTCIVRSLCLYARISMHEQPCCLLDPRSLYEAHVKTRYLRSWSDESYVIGIWTDIRKGSHCSW